MGVSKSSRLPHFLLGTSLAGYRRALRRFGGCSSSRLLKALGIGTFSSLTSPFRLYESIRHHPRIRRTELHPEPVFLIGHWQSGHSPLHMLLSRDAQFGCLDTLQSSFPLSFVCSEPFLRPLLRRVLRGKDRGSDSIRLTIDLPQGIDLPMALLCEFSAYHAYIFPQRAEDVFNRGVLLDELTGAELARWKDCYRLLMQKTAYATGRSRVLVRNASDTGRIPHLLSMFPRAKFVHITRNPFATLQATNERWESMCRLWALQDYDLAALRQCSLNFCERLLRKVLHDRDLIPPRNYVEVRYEDLCREPLETVRRIYESLGLPDYQAALPSFERHVDHDIGSLAGSTVDLDDATKDAIRSRLAFAFEAFGYSTLGPQPHDSITA